MIKYIIHNGRLKLLQQSIPNSDDKGTLVKIDYCGICGTDYQKYLNFTEEDAWGHEIVGRISNSNGEFGQPVIIRSSFPCGQCSHCQRKQYHRCDNWERRSFNGYSEYIVVDSRCIIPLECGENRPLFTLVEPLYVAINLVKKLNPQQNEQIAIIGNGTIGLLCAFYLHLLGCTNITIIARSLTKHRQMFSQLCGAQVVSYNEIANFLPEADKIINTAPYSTMIDAVRFASPYAEITFNGISKETVVPIDMRLMHFKNLVLCPSFPHPQVDFSYALSIVREYEKTLEQLITCVYPLSNLPDAFKFMTVEPKEYIKVVIRCDSTVQD